MAVANTPTSAKSYHKKQPQTENIIAACFFFYNWKFVLLEKSDSQAAQRITLCQFSPKGAGNR